MASVPSYETLCSQVEQLIRYLKTLKGSVSQDFYSKYIYTLSPYLVRLIHLEEGLKESCVSLVRTISEDWREACSEIEIVHAGQDFSG